MQQVLYAFYHTSYNLKEGYISSATERLHSEETGRRIGNVEIQKHDMCTHVNITANPMNMLM